MSKDDRIFTGENEQVDKIVFRPISIDMDAKVKKVSDPPPRPVPSALDDLNSSKWEPSEKSAKGKAIFESMQKVGGIFKYVLFTSFALASMAGIGWVVFWLMNQYDLGV